MCPLTSVRRGLSLHVEVDATATTGLDHPSDVQCELVRSVNRRRLVPLLGTVDPATYRQVRDVITTLLGP